MNKIIIWAAVIIVIIILLGYFGYVSFLKPQQEAPSVKNAQEQKEQFNNIDKQYHPTFEQIVSTFKFTK